jgi:hypothetical protein
MAIKPQVWSTRQNPAGSFVHISGSSTFLFQIFIPVAKNHNLLLTRIQEKHPHAYYGRNFDSPATKQYDMQHIKSLEEVLNTPQKKLSFYQNLVLVAAADKVLEKDESELLLFIGNRLGLTAEQVMPIADNLGVLSFIIPEDGIQKTLELQTLVQMMMQDGAVHDREYAMCLEYANRIGYGKAILDDMIQQFSNSDK